MSFGSVAPAADKWEHFRPVGNKESFAGAMLPLLELELVLLAIDVGVRDRFEEQVFEQNAISQCLTSFNGTQSNGTTGGENTD